MRKFLTVAVLGAVLLVSGACASGSENGGEKFTPKPTVTTAPAPTTTTTDSTAYFVRQCNDLYDQFTDAYTSAVDTIDSIGSYVLATTPSLAAQTKELVLTVASTGDSLASTCGMYLSSGQVSALRSSSDAMRGLAAAL